MDGKPTYSKRRPETTVLYRVVQEHFATFVAMHDQSERPLPPYVLSEFASFIKCGILAHGFCRVYCAHCGYDRLVAFSCKKRGFCSPCISRRMSGTAAHLVDRVLPLVPMRQWVLTVPHPIRYLMSYDPELCSRVVTEHVRSVFIWLRRKAKAELGLRSTTDAQAGAVTALQRFNSAAALSVHIHSVVTDGVFVRTPDGQSVTFRALSAPTNADIAAVAWSTCRRVVAYLRKQGRWTDATDAGDDSGDAFAQEQPGLAQCYTGSVLGILVLGPRAGTRVIRLRGQAASTDPFRPRFANGFDVHAGVRVFAHDRKGLERLCRYLLRPPFSRERLTRRPDGNVQLRLKRAFRCGTTHMVFEPLDFLSKLAALVPPPRAHLVRYSGVFAPNAKLRPLVVPQPQDDVQPCCHDGEGEKDSASLFSRRASWAQLMARVFEIDVLECPKCKSRMQRISIITEPSVIRAILNSVGMPADSPRSYPAKLPEQAELDFAS